MAEPHRVVYISSESELGQTLKKAAALGESIVIDIGDTQYDVDIEVRRNDALPRSPDEPDAILSIFGILESAEPSNIARYKDQYIADTIDPRPRVRRSPDHEG